MRIPCPYCGERGHEEFSYLGDAGPQRPTDGGTEATAAWEEYVYLRDNPPGVHRELWFHAAGCQSWLVMTRNIRTHELFGAEPARAVALARTA